MSADLPILAPAMPEIILALGTMVLLMFGVFKGKDSFKSTTRLTILLLLIAGVFMVTQNDGSRQLTFGNMFVSDSFAIFTKSLVLIASIASLFLATQYFKDKENERFEFPILIVTATLGMMLMISANNLMSLYMGLELQSLSLYVLAAFNRDSTKSSEAGLKYFVLGALSSGMLLYGISLIYGFSGTTDFDILSSNIQALDSMNMGLVVGLVFLMAGLAFKISAVPFHMWTPDVYEGAPTPVTAFFAAAPKIAAIALFTRVMASAFPDMMSEWKQVVIFMSIGSMLVGAFFALVQTNVKRLMAFSSIGHVGYALIGIAAGTQLGIEGLLVYLTVYMTMTLGTFGVILTMRRGGECVENISDLSGLSQNNLPMAIALSIFMFSLAGIPMLAGFFGKWYIFKAAIAADLVTLAIIGVVTSVISAYYYLRIVKVMFFDARSESFDKQKSKGLTAVIFGAAIINSPLSYFVMIAPLVVVAGWASKSLVF
jgi:NADH-quinone oxidoreductase subunit N